MRLDSLRAHFDATGFVLGVLIAAAAFGVVAVRGAGTPGGMSDARWAHDVASAAVGVARFTVVPMRLAPRADWRRAVVVTGGAIAAIEVALPMVAAVVRGAPPNWWWLLIAPVGVLGSLVGTFGFTWMVRVARGTRRGPGPRRAVGPN